MRNLEDYGIHPDTITIGPSEPTSGAGDSGILDQDVFREWAKADRTQPSKPTTADRLRALNQHGYGIVGYPNPEHDTTQYYPVRGIQPDKQPWEQDTKNWRPVCDHRHLGDQGRDEAFDCAEGDLAKRAKS